MKCAAERLPAPEHYIETPAPAMARVGSANRGDSRRVTGYGEPVVNRGSDLTPPDGWFARAMVAGNEQDKAITGILRTFESEIDRPPCAVETVAVKIDDAVRLHGPRTKFPIPRPVKGRPWFSRSQFGRLVALESGDFRFSGNGPGRRLVPRFGDLVPLDGFARQGPDGRSHPGPKLGLVRAE